MIPGAAREQFRSATLTREQGSTQDMPYMPYWFESFAPHLPWVVPGIAIVGLWVAKSSVNNQVQKTSERIYFAAMLIVAWAALRTVMANEGCWLMHMSSIGVMVLGATFPNAEIANTELDTENEMMLS